MRVRHGVTAVAVLGAEVYFYRAYAALGAQFHFWLHGLFGAALGIAALTVWRLVRRRVDGAVAPWEAGGLGHLYSALPDVLFLAFGVLHALWMDVFALHITLHFIPRPLLVMWALLALSSLSYGLAMMRRRAPALAALGLAAGLLLGAVALASDMPGTVQDLRDGPGIAWWMCPGLGHT